jgi:hypothetical protein
MTTRPAAAPTTPPRSPPAARRLPPLSPYSHYRMPSKPGHVIDHQTAMSGHPHRTVVAPTSATPSRTPRAASPLVRLVLGQQHPPRLSQPEQLGLRERRPRRRIRVPCQRFQPVQPTKCRLAQCRKQHAIHHSVPNASSARAHVGHGHAVPQMPHIPSTGLWRSSPRAATASNRIIRSDTVSCSSVRPAVLCIVRPFIRNAAGSADTSI